MPCAGRRPAAARAFRRPQSLGNSKTSLYIYLLSAERSQRRRRIVSRTFQGTYFTLTWCQPTRTITCSTNQIKSRRKAIVAFHARVFEGVAKSNFPLKAGLPCGDIDFWQSVDIHAFEGCYHLHHSGAVVSGAHLGGEVGRALVGGPLPRLYMACAPRRITRRILKRRVVQFSI